MTAHNETPSKTFKQFLGSETRIYNEFHSDLKMIGIFKQFWNAGIASQQENALLIAAAPDLLAALQKCCRVLIGETLTKSELESALVAARDAMIKAGVGS